MCVTSCTRCRQHVLGATIVRSKNFNAPPSREIHWQRMLADAGLVFGIPGDCPWGLADFDNKILRVVG